MSSPRSRTIASSLVVLMVSSMLGGAVARAGERRPVVERAPGASARAYRVALERLAAGKGDPRVVVRRALMRFAPEGVGRSWASSPTPIAVDAVAEAAGDLDADGNEDLLEHAFRFGFEPSTGAFTFRTTATGLRGPDGATLWERSNEGGGFAVAVGDLDGVVGADLVSFEIRDQLLPSSYVYDLLVDGVRGVDGASLWNRTFTSVISTGSGSGAGLDLTFPVAGDRDLDGDGSIDILLVRYQSSGYGDPSSGVAEADVTSTVEAISGRTGATIGTIVTDPVRAFADPFTLPDVTGDGIADVGILEGGVASPDGTVARPLGVYPATGGPFVWRVVASLPVGVTLPHGARLDGDALGDVLLEVRRGQPFPFFSHGGRLHLRAHTGVNGAELWSSQEFRSWMGAVLTDDATSDLGQDVLVVVDVVSSSWLAKKKKKGPSPDAHLLRGTDGALVWSRDVPGGYHAVLAGDLDGDAVTDVLIDSVKVQRRKVRDPKTGKVERRYRVREFRRAVSGRTGAKLWKMKTGRRFATPAGGDLNGDGADDIVEIRAKLVGKKRGGKALADHRRKGTYRIFVRALGGAAREPLWPGRRRVRGMLIGGFDVIARGGGGGDLASWGWTRRFDAGLTGVRSGVDGAERWLRTVAA